MIEGIIIPAFLFVVEFYAVTASIFPVLAESINNR